MEQKYYFAWTLSSQQSDGQTNCLMKTQDHDARYVVVIKCGKKLKISWSILFHLLKGRFNSI